MQELLFSSIAFFAVLSLLFLRRKGNLIIPMWAVFLVGSVIVLAFGLVTPERAVKSIDPQVMLFLFGMFTISKGLELAGDLEGLSNWLIRHSRTPLQLSLLLSFGFGLASSVVMNDSLVIMGTPILLDYSKKLKMDPKPLLYTLAFAVTLGSAMTPMGNPQNMIIATESGIKAPLLDFLLFLFPFSVISLLFLALYMLPEIKKGFSNSVSIPKGVRDQRLSRISRTSLATTIMLMLVSDILQLSGINKGLTLSESAVVGALFLLLASGRRKELIMKTEWRILVMFAGLFIFTQGLYSGGLVTSLYPYLNLLSGGNQLLLIVLSSILLSQVLSNVPLVVLLMPLFKAIIPITNPVYWAAFAASSTLAGALTLLGAASNLIVANQAEGNGVRFSYWEFAKKGIPLTLICILILFFTLLPYLYFTS